MCDGASTSSATIVDALDSGVVVLDATGRVLLWNGWMAAASNVAARAAMGRTLEELFPGRKLKRLISAVGLALSTGSPRLLTHALHHDLLPLRTRAGRVLLHDLSVRPIGPPPHATCLVQVHDVTVAVERERVLRARESARYAAIFDNAPDAILTLDAEGLIQLANPAAGHEFGLPHQDLVGMRIADFIESRDIWDRAWRTALTGELPPAPTELVARRRDGTPSYLEVSASSWDADGRIFVSVILRDVNARHHAEAELRLLNETLEERVATALAERKVLADIVESTDAMIQVVDRDFDLLAVNRASANTYQRMFGRRPQVGQNALELVDDPQRRARVRSLWARALEGETYTSIEAVQLPGQDPRFYEMTFDSLHDTAGNRFAAFAFAYDVTERLESQAHLARTEEALRQSQKMEAIGQLTGGIAHDFNNLLTGIIGAMDIIKRRLAAGKYEDTQRFLDAATTSANRAAALTHRLLAFARRQPLDPRPVDPSRLVRGIEDMLRRTLGEKVHLAVELAADAWPTLTDPNQLENAVINLAINARDAMPDGGRLTITTGRAEIRVPLTVNQEQIEPGDYTLICVGDTGIGIAPEALARVFEPFYTTKPLGEGTGLGLSMIYGFVKQTRGNVRIESEVGRGTKVSLYLPRYLGAMEPVDTHRGAPAPKGSGETVLLVEDDSSVRLLIGEVLRDLGYACVEASDGMTALPILKSNTRLDLMITDVGLPGLNGRQLADFARKHRPELRILFVTGYAEHVTGGADLLEPGMEMVTKPFTLDALAFKIREMLANTGA